MATTLPALLLILAIVAAYVSFGLPHLPHRAAFPITLIACLAMLGAARVVTTFDASAAGLAVTSLLAGHFGWLAGRRSRRPRDYNDSFDDRQIKPRDESARTPPNAANRTGDGFSVTLRIPPVSVADSTSPAAGASSAAQLADTPAAEAKPRVPRGGVAMADLSRTSLGRYRIDRVIGRGSMGVVYLGLDPMLGRQVAIKTMALGREFAGSELDEVKQRFFREAETAGRLQHRDIVTIYDVGEEQELAYIAMEFLKGQDLQRNTSADKLLPVPVVLRVGVRVAEALAYAHTPWCHSS